MKTKKRFKTLLILAVMIVSLFGTTLTVFADYNGVSDVLAAYGPGGTNNANSRTFPVSLTGYFYTTDPGNPPGTAMQQALGPDGKPYYYDENKRADIIAEAKALDAAAANKQAAKQQDDANIQNFKNVTDGMALEADIVVASKLLEGFQGVIKTLLGILVVLVSVGMTIFSGFDLCYIAFPVFRNKCEDAKQSGTGIMAGKGKTASGETKLRFVSDDAQYAVVAADTVQSGKNPFIIYFGKRVVSYVVLAILLFILLTGRVTIFTDIALKLVSGILDIIQGL